MYDFSPETPGTILRQKPDPGTDILGPTNLDLVVSRGLENNILTVPALTGLTLAAALEQTGRTGIAFEFSLRNPQEGERGGTVVGQSPPAGTSVSSNTVVNIVVTIPPGIGDGEVFGLFTHTMPRNPYPLPLRLEAVLPSGERVRIFGVEFPGGKFTVPYRLPVDSTLILTLMDRELYKETVNKR
jgi:beta-lactam-binding protein with PASTA domain